MMEPRRQKNQKPGEVLCGRIIFEKPGDDTRYVERAMEWACSSCGMRSREVEWRGSRRGRESVFSNDALLSEGIMSLWSSRPVLEFQWPLATSLKEDRG